MEDQIKMIWDFRGPSAEKTAEHHEIHLRDYLKMQNKTDRITGCEKIGDFHFSAFMIVEKSEMKPIRDALKPHRGQVYKA